MTTPDPSQLDAIYIGWEGKPRRDAAAYYGDPIDRVSKTIKDRKKIDARVQEIQRERHNEAAKLPLVGVLSAVHVVQGDGVALYSQRHNSPEAPMNGEVAQSFVQWLLRTFPGQFANSLRYGEAVPQTLIFGFDVKTMLRLAALEVLHLNATTGANIELPVKLWVNPTGAYDPYTEIVTTEALRKDHSLEAVMDFFGLGKLAALLDAHDAEAMARAAAALTQTAQLVPQLD